VGAQEDLFGRQKRIPSRGVVEQLGVRRIVLFPPQRRVGVDGDPGHGTLVEALCEAPLLAGDVEQHGLVLRQHGDAHPNVFVPSRALQLLRIEDGALDLPPDAVRRPHYAPVEIGDRLLEHDSPELVASAEHVGERVEEDQEEGPQRKDPVPRAQSPVREPEASFPRSLGATPRSGGTRARAWTWTRAWTRWRASP